MKRSTVIFAALLFAALAALVWTNLSPTGSAQRALRAQWEYATVVAAYSFNPVQDKLNKITGMTEICYVQTTGCRRQEIKYELDYGLYLQERALGESLASRKAASIKAAETALLKTLAQLGSEGWELVGEPQLEYEFVNIDDYNKFEDKSVLFGRTNAKAVYLKRIKAQ